MKNKLHSRSYIKYLSQSLLFFFSLQFFGQTSLQNEEFFAETEKLDTTKLQNLLDRINIHSFENPLDALPLVDSLEQMASTMGSLHYLSEAYGYKGSIYSYNHNGQLTRYYYKKCIEIDKLLGDDIMWANDNIALSFWHLEYGEIDSSIYSFENLLSASQVSDKPQYLAEIHTNLGLIYEYKEEFINALKSYKSAISIIEKNESDYRGINDPYVNVGYIYNELGDFSKAEEYYKESLAFNLKYESEKIRIANIHDQLGRLYLDQKKYDLSQYHFEYAISLIEEDVSYQLLFLPSLVGLAEIAMALEQAEVIERINEIIKISKDLGETENLIIGYTLKGEFFLKNGRIQEALHSCKIAYELLENFDNNVLSAQTCECLYRANKTGGNYAAALKFSEEIAILKDTIFNKKKIREFTRVDLNYEFDKEKLQDSIANAKNLELVNQEKAFLKNQNQFYLLFILGICTLLATLLLFTRKIKSQNNLIHTQNETLEELNKIKDQIFGIIGHDLRKPSIAFNKLSQKVNYLIEKNDYKSLEKLGHQIQSNGYSLQKLIDNILTWSLSQKEAINVNKSKFKLNSLITDLMATVEIIAQQKNIKLVNKTDPLILIKADKNLLFIALFNLIDNAIKFTPTEGKITLKSNLSDQGIEISIEDTGVGMNQEQIKNLFTLRKGKSTKGTKGEMGTGLGLHLVKELIDLNHGKINISSERDKGTKITIIFYHQESI